MNIKIDCLSIRVPAGMSNQAKILAQRTAKSIAEKMNYEIGNNTTFQSSDKNIKIKIPVNHSMQFTADAAAEAIARHIGRNRT